MIIAEQAMTDHKKNPLAIHWGWIVLGSSFITLFINYSIRIGAYSVLLPKMIQEIGITLTQAGMIRAAYILTYVLFSPLTGWLADRIGGRWVISFFCLFLGMGTLFMGQVSNLFTAIFFHGIVGLGASAMWVPIVSLIQKWFGTTRRGLALGILSPSYSLGFGLMGLILPVIVKNYSWRIGWTLLGISGLVLIGMNLFLLRNDPEEMGLLPWGETTRSVSSSLPRNVSFNYWDIFQKGSFWLIGISYAFISAGAYVVSDFMVTYGVMELKISYQSASTFISMMAATSVAGSLLLMAFSDRIGRKKSLMIIHFSLALSILIILLARRNIPLLWIGIGCFGFFYGAIWPMYAACVRDYFPKDMTGTILGTITLFYGVGAIVGPILAGYLADLTQTFQWSFGLGVLVSLIAAAMVCFLGKPIEVE
jgi:sugar phosphate permease